MKNKNTRKHELEQKRPTFLLLGLVTALAIAYGMLNLETRSAPNPPICKGTVVSLADEYSIPITRQDRKQPEVDKEIKERQAELKDIFVEVANETKVNIINEPIDDGLNQLDEIPIFREEPVMEVDIYALEKMPVFPGCEDLLDEEARYNCFVQQISKHVVSNFKPCEGAFGISKERLYIQFTIDEKGKVTAAKAVRGSDECNVSRALWVVNDLPKMKPGEYRGKTVRTRFVLPINIK